MGLSGVDPRMDLDLWDDPGADLDPWNDPGMDSDPWDDPRMIPGRIWEWLPPAAAPVPGIKISWDKNRLGLGEARLGWALDLAAPVPAGKSWGLLGNAHSQG